MDIYYNSVSLLYDLALESMHIYNTPCLHCNIVPLIGLTELYMSPDEEFVHIDTCNIYKRYTDSKSVGPNLISYPQLDDRIPYCLLYTEHLTNVHFCRWPYCLLYTEHLTNVHFFRWPYCLLYTEHLTNVHFCRWPYCLLYTEHLTNVHFCLDIINYNSEKTVFVQNCIP